MTVEYLDLAEFIAIAAEVTGLEVDTVMKVANLDLADSALHAPAAGFSDTDFYPDFIDKAAVLVVRLAANHALPDGNKRAAWVALRLFVEINGWRWEPVPTSRPAATTRRRTGLSPALSRPGRITSGRASPSRTSPQPRAQVVRNMR